MIIDDAESWRDLVSMNRLGPYWMPEWASMWTEDETALALTADAWAVLIIGDTVRSPSGDTGIRLCQGGDLNDLRDDLDELGRPARLKIDPLSTVRASEDWPPCVVIDLRSWAPSDMSATHRRHVRNAQKRFTVSVETNPSDDLIEQFACIYAETERSRNFDVPLSTLQIAKAFEHMDAVMSAVMDGPNLAAAVVGFRAHGVFAYHWGATGNEYRDADAPAKLAMVRAFDWSGCETAIMGPGSEVGDGLQRFKESFGRADLRPQGMVSYG